MSDKLILPDVGAQVGSYTVINNNISAPIGKNGQYILAQCSCGNVQPMSVSYFYSKKYKKSYTCKKCSNSSKFKGIHLLSGYYFNQLRHGATSRNLEFCIDLEYLWDLFEQQNRLCALTKLPITLSPTYGIDFKKQDKHKQTASLDRIDSNKGYIIGNVQWVHKTINRMKSNLVEDYFVDLCKLVVQNTSNIKHTTKIISRLSVEGVHRWKNCPIEEVSYLRDYHRHVFNINCYCYVTHNDRDIEFIQLSHNIEKYLSDKYFNNQFQCLFFDDMSCEMIATELVNHFNLYEVEVNEDGEGGSIVSRL